VKGPRNSARAAVRGSYCLCIYSLGSTITSGLRLCTVRLETPRGSEELEIMGRSPSVSFTMILQSPRRQSMEMADDSIDDSRLTLIWHVNCRLQSSIGSGIPQLREDRGERSPSSIVCPLISGTAPQRRTDCHHSDSDQDEAGSPKSTR
jgi:hypothetical protein